MPEEAELRKTRSQVPGRAEAAARNLRSQKGVGDWKSWNFAWLDKYVPEELNSCTLSAWSDLIQERCEADDAERSLRNAAGALTWQASFQVSDLPFEEEVKKQQRRTL